MKNQGRGTGRVASLAHLETIRKGSGGGLDQQAVYDTHGPKLGITCSQCRGTFAEGVASQWM